MMEHFCHTIPGFFTFSDIYRYMVNFYPSGSHFVEVGSWFGKSTVFMAVEIISSGKNIKFDAVDTWKSDYIPETFLVEGTLEYEAVVKKGNIFYEFLRNIESVKYIVNPIRLDSVKAANLYDDKSLEFVFIDASHVYENVLSDIKAWFPKVKQGGHIAGHDYPAPDVKRAVDEFFNGKMFYCDFNQQGIWSYFLG